MICNETILLALLVIAIIFLILKWMSGDPAVESPRSQMGILEELLRARGFKTLVPMVRDFEKFNEDTFLDELQRAMIPFSQDKDFSSDWLEPILFSNLALIMQDEDFLRKFDLHLRREYGYRLKPIRHVQYGLRPEVRMHATTEEQDVCFREDAEVSLERGHKTYRPLQEVKEVDAGVTLASVEKTAKVAKVEDDD